MRFEVTLRAKGPWHREGDHMSRTEATLTLPIEVDDDLSSFTALPADRAMEKAAPAAVILGRALEEIRPGEEFRISMAAEQL